MIKLMKLEWKKNNIKKYILHAFVLAGLLCLFVFATAFWGIANDADGSLDAAPGKDTVSAMVELFSGMVYLVFTSVMLASFIVSAYKNKTMNIMFSYPIKRQKILASQMCAVWIFNYIALTVTKLLMYGCIYAGAESMHSALVVDYDMTRLSFFGMLLVKSAVIVSMGFIALFVGMAMKSSKASIITSFLLIFLTQANVGDITMADNAVFPFILTIISFLFAVLSLWHVETRDLD